MQVRWTVNLCSFFGVYEGLLVGRFYQKRTAYTNIYDLKQHLDKDILSVSASGGVC